MECNMLILFCDYSLCLPSWIDLGKVKRNVLAVIFYLQYFLNVINKHLCSLHLN